jgi:type IV pilus assembly protein PilX
MKLLFDLGDRPSTWVLSSRPHPGSAQRGVVLIVALVALLMMTMIGVTAMRDTGFQERMSGNLRDRNLAFQAAEAALRTGESWLVNNATTATFAVRIDDPASWNGSSSPTSTGTATLSAGQVAANPAFHVGSPRWIEPLGAPCDGTTPNCGWCIYPITTHGVGGSNDAVVVIQAQYQLTGVHCQP